MAKRALFNVDAEISMLDNPMNDEELSDDDFGGYMSCEEVETSEVLVPCEEIPDQEFDVCTDNFVCSSTLQPTTTTQLHPPTTTTPTTTMPTTTSHDTPQGLHALWIW